MARALTREQLCYEVWITRHDAIEPRPELIASYWDVMDAWNVANGISQTDDRRNEMEVNVIVASGMQRDVLTDALSPRPDVIPKRN